MSDKRPATPSLARRIAETLWVQSIDSSERLARRGSRMRRKRPRPELLGIERPRPFRGIIQGQRKAKWPEPLGYADVTEALRSRPKGDTSSAYAQWRMAVYESGSPIDVQAKSRSAKADDGPSNETVALLTRVLQRAAVASEVRRIKRLR